MSGAEKGIYEPFTSPLDGERHIFVVGAKKAAKAGVSEGENDESGEGGEGIIVPVGEREQLAKERHPAVPGAFALHSSSHPSSVTFTTRARLFSLSHLSPLSSPPQCPSLCLLHTDLPFSPLLLEILPVHPRPAPQPLF
jgi:hypothetical protein